MEIVSSAELSITYDGELVRTGLMDVQELAPALLASSTLIQKANAVLNGETTSVSLKVRSDFRHGSFVVHCVVDQSLLEQAKNFLLAHPSIKDVKEILETIFFYAGIPITATASLFRLIKFLGRRKPDAVEIHNNNGTVTVVLGDQNIVVNQAIYKLYEDSQARRAASILVEPLGREGIDTLEIKRGDEIEKVTKEEAEAFEYSVADAETLLDNVAESWLSVIGLSFNPKHKWRFTTGGSNLMAEIADSQFWQRIHTHQETFEEGDQLLVSLRTSTSRDPDGRLQTTYTVEHVLRHVRAPKQSKLGL